MVENVLCAVDVQGKGEVLKDHGPSLPVHRDPSAPAQEKNFSWSCLRKGVNCWAHCSQVHITEHDCGWRFRYYCPGKTTLWCWRGCDDLRCREAEEAINKCGFIPVGQGTEELWRPFWIYVQRKPTLEYRRDRKRQGWRRRKWGGRGEEEGTEHSD